MQSWNITDLFISLCRTSLVRRVIAQYLFSPACWNHLAYLFDLHILSWASHLKRSSVFASRRMNNAPSNFSHTKAHKMHDKPPKLSLYSTNPPEGAAPLFLVSCIFWATGWDTMLQPIRKHDEWEWVWRERFFELDLLSEHPRSTFIRGSAPSLHHPEHGTTTLAAATLAASRTHQESCSRTNEWERDARRHSVMKRRDLLTSLYHRVSLVQASPVLTIKALTQG